MQRLSHLPDDALLDGLHLIVGSHRQVTAELVLHLGEVDARRLHVEKGYSSLFRYCVERLGFSDDEACRRIEAARLARRFPVIYGLLQTGAISLTVLGFLKPHLTEGNHQELLGAVSGSSSRQAKERIAARFPEPDVPSTIRKLPGRRAPAMPSAPSAQAPAAVTSAPPAQAPAAVTSVPSAQAPAAPRIDGVSDGPGLALASTPRIDGVSDGPGLAPGVTPLLAASSSRPTQVHAPARARVEPLSRDRFLVKFTASRDLRDKLKLARDLMSHANPEGDLAVVLGRAVDLLIAQLEKRKLGRTSRPRKERDPTPGAGSIEPPSATTCAATNERGAPNGSAPTSTTARFENAEVTRATRRTVVARDGFSCSFVTNDGHRCGARAFLEFDHVVPRGRGGGSEADNVRLLCRAHNRSAAEDVYGAAHVSRAISDSRARPREPS